MSAVDTDDDWCGRCGSSVLHELCGTCEATGGLETAFGPGDPSCPTCRGSGWMRSCLSSPAWCEAHPLPGCADRPRHSAPEGADQ